MSLNVVDLRSIPEPQETVSPDLKLTPELLDNTLNSGASHPHTGSHRVHVTVLRVHGDLGPFSRFPGRTHDFDDSL